MTRCATWMSYNVIQTDVLWQMSTYYSTVQLPIYQGEATAWEMLLLHWMRHCSQLGSNTLHVAFLRHHSLPSIYMKAHFGVALMLCMQFIDIFDVSKGYTRIIRCGGHSATVTHIDWSADSRVIQSNDSAYEVCLHAVWLRR